jgi:hypothetical protein
LWDTAYRLNQTTGSAIHRIFGAANEFEKNASALFTHDRIIYKLRHEWGLALAEFRAAAKAEVA